MRIRILNVPRVSCGESLNVAHGGKTVQVEVKDCGPRSSGRVIDLSTRDGGAGITQPVIELSFLTSTGADEAAPSNTIWRRI
jgi:hypothetical protein